jgi:hypothetical protein
MNLNKALMVRTKFLIVFLMILTGPTALLFAQKDQIPLEPQLEKFSERQLIKIGMVSASKPAKLKFGAFNTDNRKGKSTTSGDDASELLFSFDLMNTKGDLAKVEASANQVSSKMPKESEQQNDISVYITTSLDQDDLWVLLISKTAENKDLSLKDIFLTNGNEEITFKHVIGMPTNKSEVTAPKGIEAFLDDVPVAAMQYYSGGSFSYKKFIWISEQSEPQIQLVIASVFSAMLEIGNYFEGNGFID